MGTFKENAKGGPQILRCKSPQRVFRIKQEDRNIWISLYYRIKMSNLAGQLLC